MTNISSFTDEQLLNLVNSTIIKKTEFEPADFTGGSVQITSTHSHKITNYRISLYFGYSSKKPITRTIEISKDLFYIWSKAMMLKVLSLQNDNVGMDFNELNALMNVTPSVEGIKTSIIKQDEIEIINNEGIKVLEIAKYLLKKIKTINPNFKTPNWKVWNKDIELAIRADGRTAEELTQCIDWIYSPSGAFWQKHILSAKKLREKYDTIYMQAQSGRVKTIAADIYASGTTPLELLKRAGGAK